MLARSTICSRLLLVLVLVTTLTISACSIRIMYDYLDWIIPWYLDDYVTLTDEQEKLFDTSTMRFLRWHRSEELPRYTAFLTALKEAQKEPMSQEKVLLFFDEANDLWLALLRESLPDILLLAGQFNESQISEINSALGEDIEDLREKYGNKEPDEQVTFWQERMEDGLEDWLGGLTEQQLLLIQQWSKAKLNTTDQWLAFRESWRTQAIGLLKSRTGDSFNSEMESFLLNPQALYPPAYAQSVYHNRLLFAQLVADISATLNDKQRSHLYNELDDMISDITALKNQQG